MAGPIVPLRACWSIALMLLLGVSTGASAAIDVPPTVKVAPRQVTIWWSTTTSSTTEVYWGPTSQPEVTGYPNQSIYSGFAGRLHSRTLRGVPPGTWYYRVRSVDETVASVSAEGTFTVPGPDSQSNLDELAFDGEVFAVAKLGPQIFVGGNFSTVRPRRGNGVRMDTATGALAKDLPMVAGEVLTVVSDGNGGFFIGGDFRYVGGLARNHAAHILPDGGIDPNWNPSPDGPVFAIAASGNTVYLGGSFTSLNGGTRPYAAAVDAATGAPTSWNPGVNNHVAALAVSGSTVYLGGSFTVVNGTTQRGYVAAVDATSGTATTWNPGPNGGVTAIVVSGGAVYLGGSFTAFGSTPRRHAAAVDAVTGTLTPWNPDPDKSVTSLAVSGSVAYLGGYFTTVNGGAARPYAAAVDATTGVLTPWDPAPDGPVVDLAVGGDAVYLGGYFTIIKGTPRRYVAAVDAVTGSPTAWNPGPNGAVHALALYGNAIFLGGAFTGVDGAVIRRGAAALNAKTGALTDWDPRLNGSVHTLAAFGDTVYLGGTFSSANGGVARSRAAAVDATAGLVRPWNPGLNGPVYTMAVSGSTVYLGGEFTTATGVARNNAAAVDARTGTLTPWNPNLDAPVITMAVAGSTVYLGGKFTKANGTTARNRAAAVDATTGTLTAWNPNLNDAVFALAVAQDVVYLGGRFTSANGGTTRRSAAAVNATTGALVTWNPNVSGVVHGLGLLGNDVYIQGVFSMVNASTRSSIVATDSTYGVLTSWNPDAVTNVQSDVQHVILPDCAEGRLYVAHQTERVGTSSGGGLSTFVSGISCPGNPPQIVDNQPGDDFWRNANTGLYDVDIADTEALASLEIRVYSAPGFEGTVIQDWTTIVQPLGTWFDGDWALPPATWSALPEGTAYVAVRVTDTQGNTAVQPDVFHVRKDTVAPSGITGLTAGMVEGMPRLTWTAATDATSGVAFYRVYRAPSATGPWTRVSQDRVQTSTTFTDTTAAPGGAYWYDVYPVDLAGNESTVAPPPVLVDLRSPDTSIVSGPPAFVASPSASFSFSSTAAEARFECSLDDSAFTSCPASITFTGLADGKHLLVVRAMGLDGVADPTPATHAWTVDTVPPAAPTIGAPAQGELTVDRSVRISGTAEAGAHVSVLLDGSPGCTALAEATGSWSCEPTSVLAEGPHTAKATAKDRAGNISPPSEEVSFRVTGGAPRAYRVACGCGAAQGGSSLAWVVLGLAAWLLVSRRARAGRG